MLLQHRLQWRRRSARRLKGAWRSSMVDCYDRIALQIAEMALEPVRLMRERSLLAAVAVRALRGGDRFTITIRKIWPEGMDRPPIYRWSLAQTDETGGERPDRLGLAAASARSGTYADPEEAYWAAVNALSAAASSSCSPFAHPPNPRRPTLPRAARAARAASAAARRAPRERPSAR